MIVNISEAKTNLSKLIDRVYHGEKITIAKNNLPIADLVLHKPAGKRTLGLFQGKGVIPDDFLNDDNEVDELFYEGSV